MVDSYEASFARGLACRRSWSMHWMMELFVARNLSLGSKKDVYNVPTPVVGAGVVSPHVIPLFLFPRNITTWYSPLAQPPPPMRKHRGGRVLRAGTSHVPHFPFIFTGCPSIEGGARPHNSKFLCKFHAQIVLLQKKLKSIPLVRS